MPLSVVHADGYFRFLDPNTGQILPDYHEMTVMRDDAEARAQAAEARAQAAEARARAADARAAELERQLDDLGSSPP